MSGSSAFSYNQSKQAAQQQSEHGISSAYRGALSSDAYTENQYLTDQTRQAVESPFGYYRGQHVNQLVPQGQYGLPAQVDNMVGALGNQWFNKASAGGAMRGQVTPENTNNVVGSAMTNAAQFLTPYILANQQYLQGLPKNLYNQDLGFLQASQSAKASMLGGQSSGTSTGSSFGFSKSDSASV